MRTQYINAKLFNKKETSFITNNDRFESFGIVDEALDKVDLKGQTVFPGFFDTDSWI